jgi:hypothetical protein
MRRRRAARRIARCPGATPAANAAHLLGVFRMHPARLLVLGLATASVAFAADPLETIPRPFHPGLPALPVTAYAPGADGEPASDPPRWDVRTQDITLAHTLERWASAAGYRFKWDAQRNFLIGAPDSYGGSFESALQTVLGSAGIRDSDYPLEACIYANTPPLVRITRAGEQARECAVQ